MPSFPNGRPAARPMPYRSSRLTFRRRRRPTPLPTLRSNGVFGRCLDRLSWLFG